jgi:hypothetical protein
MQNQTMQAPMLLPFKSVAGALWFCVLLGPVGLLYASFWGGFLMILAGIIVFSNHFIFPAILLWIICCVWGVRAVEKYNRNLLKRYLAR